MPHWPDADTARSWFVAERTNLLAVEAYARGHDQPGTAARLAYAMAGFLNAECHWHDAHAVLRPAVEHWSHTDDSAALCRALSHLSTLHAHAGRYPEAAETGERALEIARATADVEAEGRPCERSAPSTGTWANTAPLSSSSRNRSASQPFPAIRGTEPAATTTSR